MELAKNVPSNVGTGTQRAAPEGNECTFATRGAAAGQAPVVRITRSSEDVVEGFWPL